MKEHFRTNLVPTLLLPGLGGSRFYGFIAEADYSLIIHREGSDRAAAIVAGTKEADFQWLQQSKFRYFTASPWTRRA